MTRLFIGPPELDSIWDDAGIDGVYRFLCRFYNLVLTGIEANVPATDEMVKLRNKMVYDITKRLEAFSLNTVVSGFMEYTNKFNAIAKEKGGVDKETIETMIRLMAPFAPHIAEELWQEAGHEESVFDCKLGWPQYDENLIKDDEIEIGVQVNGKLKCTVKIPADADSETAIAAAKEALADKLTGNIVKEIYVPGRIINIVAK